MTAIKDFVKTLDGKPVLVFGLGRSGMSSVKALKAAGATIVAGDDSDENFLSLRKMGVEILGDVERPFSDYAFLLLSPGIPFTHPRPHDVVQKALDVGGEVICDMELFSRIYPAYKTIGITGTNGKSTTSSLVHHILHSCGKKTQLGGNIGTPVFDLDCRDPETWFVFEMSSFQIDLCPIFRPDIAAILNITPDHIDRHGSMERYIEVKESLTEISKTSLLNVGVLCSDDTSTHKICDRARALALREIIEVSTLKALESGVYILDGIIYDSCEGRVHEAGDISKIQSLTGVHNYQNAITAYAVARKIGLQPDEIMQAMQTFPGLNHRQYVVRTMNGVTYVNDSKATNAASAAMALGCRDNIYWIVGGRKKKTGLEGIESFFPHIKHAFLIGESTDDFADWLDKYGIQYTRCYELGRAVDLAHSMAQENRGQPGGAGVVLLSPACASFDQFKSFEDRGDRFAAIVQALDE